MLGPKGLVSAFVFDGLHDTVSLLADDRHSGLERPKFVRWDLPQYTIAVATQMLGLDWTGNVSAFFKKRNEDGD